MCQGYPDSSNVLFCFPFWEPTTRLVPSPRVVLRDLGSDGSYWGSSVAQPIISRAASCRNPYAHNSEKKRHISSRLHALMPDENMKRLFS
jgi:hypothetical protein